MAVVTVQVGQCGNQVGGQLFSTLVDDMYQKPSKLNINPKLNKDYIQCSTERFFTETGKKHDDDEILQARAVMVDMEPKVIAQTCAEAKKSGKWQYRETQIHKEKRGSGNNWAHGYCIHAHTISEKVMEVVQKEVEKCDHFGGFMILLSLAGGTGSGVGAYLTQCLRDDYPHSFIMDQVIWPYQTGEVIVQNYNALLTLSHLYQNADAIMVVENDNLHKICSHLLNIKKVSFRDINTLLAQKMASILQPAFKSGSSTYPTNYLGEMMEHLVPQPDYKLLTLNNIPHTSDRARDFSRFEWPGLVRNIRQMLIANCAMEEGINWSIQSSSTDCNKSIANLLVLRGQGVEKVQTQVLHEAKLYANWMPPGCQVVELSQPRLFNMYEKSAALLSNSRAPIRALNQVVGKAWGMFSARAYLHQYTKHGLVEDDFLDSFACLEQVIANYSQL